MEEIVVIGGGGHARVVLSILGKLKRFNILGYTDLADHGPLLGHLFSGRTAASRPSPPRILR